MTCRCCRSPVCPQPRGPLPPPPPPSPWEGVYERQPVENGWHRGTLKSSADPVDGATSLLWTNEAGASWPLSPPDDPSGRTGWTSRTGTTCPYGENEVPFSAGETMSFNFLGECYVRVADLPESKTAEAEALLESLGHRGALSDAGLQALQTYIEVAGNYKKGAFEEARACLQQLWQQAPPGEERWAQARHLYAGPNYGSPTCYYLFRMLDDVLAFHTSGVERQNPPMPYNFTVVALRRVATNMPPTYGDWVTGQAEEWPEVELGIHKAFLGGETGGIEDDEGMASAAVCHTTWAADVPPFLRTALYWWGEYIHAISGGRLAMRVTFYLIDPPTLAKCTFSKNDGRQFAGVDDIHQVVASQLPEDVLAESDIFAFFYPSPVPPDGSFQEVSPDVNLEWVTGGAGGAPRGQPMFIADDLFFIRVPPHLGHGLMSSWERQTYLPQWWQHEFNHHLFGFQDLYREHELESGKGHNWFDRSTWPPDFEGIHEPDYYHEAMHKRFLLPTSHPPLWYRLKLGAWRGEAVDALSSAPGEWVLATGPQNDWHYVTITSDGGDGLMWTNRAGASWPLVLDTSGQGLSTTTECPYGVQAVTLQRGKPPLQGYGAEAELSDEPGPLTLIFMADKFQLQQ